MFRGKRYAHLSIVLIFVGALLVGKSVYFYARGVLAQIFLEHAWTESKKTHKFIRPWAWADTYPVGRLIIPSIDFSRIVLQGASNESLAFGPGHIAASSQPGEKGNIAIVGHRDNFFRDLRKVKKDEIIRLESLDTVQTYRVTDIQIASPQETSWIDDTSASVITLITCYPFEFVGLAPERYVVRGELM